MGKKSRKKNTQETVLTSTVAGVEAIKISSLALLAVLVAVCLTPFLGKAFHIDDALFVWAARQIAQHPSDPYGFTVNWYTAPQPMWEVTQNPPLSSYYMAGIARLWGWSEPALHAGFLLVALAAILGTYALARRLTRWPLLAAAATLAAPGFLVSSTTLMCDTMMLALWIFAILFWLDGLERKRPVLLAISALLIAVCALTKYFGVALIPLLLVYSMVRTRRIDSSLLYLLLPVAALAGYQSWTGALYGKGLLGGAAQYAQAFNSASFYKVLVGLSFAGGCALPALTFAPLIWSRRMILLAAAAAGGACFLVGIGVIGMPAGPAQDHRHIVSAQMALFVAGGIGALALAVSDWRRRGDADSLLLLLWIVGTWLFSWCVNWSVNARSVLPMVPAVGILLARRLELGGAPAGKLQMARLIVPLALSGGVSLWVTWADASQANSSRMAAQYARDRLSTPGSKVSFEGHWGFQYYMQAYGFQPVDFRNFIAAKGDIIIIPENNTSAAVQTIPAAAVISKETFAFPIKTGATTMDQSGGSGFYSDVWGPMPYAFGPAYSEVYNVLRVRNPSEASPK